MGNIRENIATSIAQNRARLGLSQKELADKVGAKSLTTVSSWERGANAPDVETLFKLCDLFGISVDEMYGVQERSNEIRQYLKFCDYLKSLGYIVEDKIIQWHYGETLDEFGNREQIVDESVTTIQKGKESVTYTPEGFEKFQEAIMKSIEFQLWDKAR